MKLHAKTSVCCVLVQTLLRQFIPASSAKCIPGIQGIRKTCPTVRTHRTSRQFTSLGCSFFEFPTFRRKAFMETSSLQDSESFHLETVWQNFSLKWDKRVWRTLVSFQYQYRIIWKTDLSWKILKNANKEQHNVSICCLLNLNKDQNSMFLQYKTYSYFILFLLKQQNRTKFCKVLTAMRKGSVFVINTFYFWNLHQRGFGTQTFRQINSLLLIQIRYNVLNQQLKSLCFR